MCMKKKQEERNRENDEFIKEILKDEKVPEYDPIAAFSRFEKKYLACKEESEEANKANKKKAKKEKPKDFFRDNKFKWKYWGPALATAIIVVPISCMITSTVIKSQTLYYDEYDLVKKELDKSFKFVLFVDVLYCSNENKDLTPYVFFCLNSNIDYYFVAYAPVKSNEEVSIKIGTEIGSIVEASRYYIKKLSNTEEFEYQVSFDGGGYNDTFTYRTARYIERYKS